MIKSITLNKIKPKVQSFLFEDLMPIPKGTVSMLASSGGRGKTFLGIRLAMKHIKDTGKRVAVWMTEDEPEFIKQRAIEIIKTGLEDCNQSKLEVITNAPPQLAYKENGIFKANYDDFKEIRSWCILKEIDFIILDPLLAFYGGDENDNSQARIFMQPFIEWSKNDGTTVLIIHHANKLSGETRGAGALVDATRCVYELHLVLDDEDKPDMDAYKRGERMLRLKKDNRGARRLLSSRGIDGDYMIQVTPNFSIKKSVEVIYDAPKI